MKGLLAVAAAVALLVGTASAQVPPPVAGAGGAGGARGGAVPIPADGRTAEQLRNEVLERMRALRAWRIVDALRLDQATSGRLFPVLAKYDDRELALATERQEIVRQLRAEVHAPHPDDARLTASINRLLANRGKQRALEDERLKELRKVLTPTQQAKLVMLLPRLEREFARRVRDAADDQRRFTDDDAL